MIAETESRYSAIEHIARSLNYGEKGLFCMFTGYFDDAGGVDHGYTVVAGWVSTLEKWESLAEQWSRMLATFGVAHFDMKTLSHFKGIYRHWKDRPEVKDAFVAEACRVIASNVVFGFAAVVEHSIFKKVNQAFRLKEYIGNEYALAGLTCCLHLRDWIYRQTPPEPFEIVFHDGTAKRGRLVDAMRREHFAEPIFRAAIQKENMSPPVIQIQAADFLAYEVRKIRADDPDEDKPIEQHRMSLRKLIWVESEWITYTEDDLVKICQGHPHIKPR